MFKKGWRMNRETGRQHMARSKLLLINQYVVKLFGWCDIGPQVPHAWETGRLTFLLMVPCFCSCSVIISGSGFEP